MYRHHCRGSLKGKIIFFGVTLWLTSTVIAGVRRASGWTHNAHSLTQSSAESDERRKQWRRMMDERLAASRQFAEARFQQLEQHYGNMVADEQTRQQWKQWLSMEKEKLINEWTRNSLWFERNMDRFHNPDAYQNGCHRPGGFMRWYLGVGERTFDWFTRKLAGSRSFHWENPQTPYQVLGQTPAGPTGATPPPFDNAGAASVSAPPPPPPPPQAGPHGHPHLQSPPPPQFPNAFPGQLGQFPSPPPFIASAPPAPAGVAAPTDPASTSTDPKTT
ncbi:hypothetical protein EC988_003572 [Linderina pennispora]|nr:hypothetical protein EC988_003572 [Linderina pennispora]